MLTRQKVLIKHQSTVYFKLTFLNLDIYVNTWVPTCCQQNSDSELQLYYYKSSVFLQARSKHFVTKLIFLTRFSPQHSLRVTYKEKLMNNTFKLSATDATIKNKLIHIIIVIVLDENFEQQKLNEHSVDKRQETATMPRAESQTVGLKSRSAVFFFVICVRAFVTRQKCRYVFSYYCIYFRIQQLHINYYDFILKRKCHGLFIQVWFTYKFFNVGICTLPSSTAVNLFLRFY